jgi:hypothetical protein
MLGSLRRLLETIFQILARERYRPELHYMRGPGPKFRKRAGEQ